METIQYHSELRIQVRNWSKKPETAQKWVTFQYDWTIDIWNKIVCLSGRIHSFKVRCLQGRIRILYISDQTCSIWHRNSATIIKKTWDLPCMNASATSSIISSSHTVFYRKKEKLTGFWLTESDKKFTRRCPTQWISCMRFNGSGARSLIDQFQTWRVLRIRFHIHRIPVPTSEPEGCEHSFWLTWSGFDNSEKCGSRDKQGTSIEP